MTTIALTSIFLATVSIVFARSTAMDPTGKTYLLFDGRRAVVQNDGRLAVTTQGVKAYLPFGNYRLLNGTTLMVGADERAVPPHTFSTARDRRAAAAAAGTPSPNPFPTSS